jgi:bifunctional oligoribonuclease and PAP phosphatase NrnA
MLVVGVMMMFDYDESYFTTVRHVANILSDSQRFWLFPHEDPDGDAFGSTLALHIALKKMGKEVRSFSYNDIPRMYSKLPYLDQIEINAELLGDVPDVIVVLDNAEFERIGDGYREKLAQLGIEPKAIGRRPMLINIDHHISNTEFGDINLVNAQCAATGIIVYDLLLEMGCELLPEIVENIYVALVTDTGRFSFCNTDERAFEVAGELTALGVEPAKVIENVYYTRSKPQMQLFGKIFDTLTEVPNLGVVYAWQTKQMLEETRTRQSDTEGVVDLIRTIADFPISLFFKENHKGIKVSVRSKSSFNAAKFALYFNGGGHPGASGFTVKDSLDKAIDIVLHAIEKEQQSKVS